MKYYLEPDHYIKSKIDMPKVECMACGKRFKSSPYNQNTRCPDCFEKYCTELREMSKGLKLMVKEINEWDHKTLVDYEKDILRGEE